ncbi:MAG: hypothetical protein KDC38_18750, partial [Planctomycetes bacterium]|nr:hypothetical protein [Planctomycetota bacterium]
KRSAAVLPRVLTGLGGLVILGFGLVDVGGGRVIGILFEPEAWQMAWPLMFVLIGILGFAVGGITAAFRGEGLPTTAVSILARAVMAGLPLSIFIGRMGVPGLSGFDQGGVTTVTATFKIFGMFYALLVITGLGLASLLALKLMGDRGSAGWDEVDLSKYEQPDPEPELAERR